MATKKTAQVTITDKGYARLMRRAAKMAKTTAVTLGVHGEEGAVQATGAEGLTVADIASIHEYGLGDMPARSFIGSWALETHDEKREDMLKLAQAVLAEKVSPEQGFGILGEKYVAQIRARIRAGIAPPNAESTIQRKGSSTPLINTGQLVAAITYKVEGSGS